MIREKVSRETAKIKTEQNVWNDVRKDRRRSKETNRKIKNYEWKDYFKLLNGTDERKEEVGK